MHRGEECAQRRPRAEQVAEGQVWSPVECCLEHHRLVATAEHLGVWGPNWWQLWHWDLGPKRRRRSRRNVEEKAERRGRAARSCAFGPVMVMTTVDAFLLARWSSGLSHLGGCASASPVLKVESCWPMSARE